MIAASNGKKGNGMKRICAAWVPALFVPMALIVLVSCIRNGGNTRISPGEEAFMTHCSVCHVKGGNVITPAKTLYKKDLAKSNILTTTDIVATIRNPGPGMRKFDETTIPDKTADAIAEYVLNAFQ